MTQHYVIANIMCIINMYMMMCILWYPCQPHIYKILVTNNNLNLFILPTSVSCYKLYQIILMWLCDKPHVYTVQLHDHEYLNIVKMKWFDVSMIFMKIEKFTSLSLFIILYLVTYYLFIGGNLPALYQVVSLLQQ